MFLKISILGNLLMFRTLIIIFSLFFVWLIFSGMFLPIFVFFGVFSSILVAFLIVFIFQLPHLIFTRTIMLKYFVWLLYQMFISSIYVTKIVLSPRKRNLNSVIIVVEDRYDNDFLSALFMNSVTITPGSATVFSEGSKIFIHLLDCELEDGVRKMYDKIYKQFSM